MSDNTQDVEGLVSIERAKIQSLESALLSEQYANSDLRRKLEERNARVRELERDLNDSLIRAEKSAYALAEQTEKARNAEEGLKTAQAESTKYLDQIEAAQSDEATAKKSEAKALEKMAESEDALAATKFELETAKDELKRVRYENERLQSEINSAQTALALAAAVKAVAS